MSNRNLCPQSATERVFGGVSLSSANGAKAAQAASVKEAGTVDKGSREKGRKQAYRDVSRLRAEALKQEAGKILRTYEVKGAGSVTCCGTKSRYNGNVTLRYNVATERASFGGLLTCANVWACPTCGKRIAKARAEEANLALSAARKEGLSVYLVTLTYRHNSKMELAASLDALKRAKQRLCQRAEYRRLPLVGTITATEVTHGDRNGWHPHLHLLTFMECGEDAGLKSLRALAKVWRRCLQSFGLDGGKAALDVRAGTASGDYIAKSWAAAEELTLGHEKTGKSGGRSPMQLLADASDGCSASRALWAEYARAFAGRRQLVWSRGLKARFQVTEKTDAEAAEAAEAAQAQSIVLRTFTATEWEIVRVRKLAILRAAERGRSVERAMYAPTDAERWRRWNGDPWERDA